MEQERPGSNLSSVTPAPGSYDEWIEFARTATHGWHEEETKYPYDNPHFEDAWGHFTQMVWRNSSSIGCAVGHCSDQVEYPGRFYCCKSHSSIYLRGEERLGGRREWGVGGGGMGGGEGRGDVECVLICGCVQTTTSTAITSLPDSFSSRFGARFAAIRRSRTLGRARIPNSTGLLARSRGF